MRFFARPAWVRRSVAALAVAVMLCGVPASSQQTGADPRAHAALERMREAYNSLDAFHIKVTWTARYAGGMSRDDFPLPGPDVLELRMQRPNRFFMSASAAGDRKPSRYLIVSDGTTLWYWRGATNTYTQTRAPETLAGMVSLLPPDAIGTFDGTTWTADSIMEWDLLVTGIEPMTRLAESGLAITLGAPAKVDGVPVNVVQLEPPAGSPVPFTTQVTLHLSAANHLIRGYRLVSRGKHPETGRDFSVSMQASYDLHETQPRFSPSDFTFTPPAGAKRTGGLDR